MDVQILRICGSRASGSAAPKRSCFVAKVMVALSTPSRAWIRSSILEAQWAQRGSPECRHALRWEHCGSDRGGHDLRKHNHSARHGCEGARVHDVHVYDPHNHSRSAHGGDDAHDRDVLHAHHGCDAHARDRSRRNLRTSWNLSLIFFHMNSPCWFVCFFIWIYELMFIWLFNHIWKYLSTAFQRTDQRKVKFIAKEI